MSPEFIDTATLWGLRILSATTILAIGLWLAFFLSKLVRNQAQKHPHVDQTLSAFFSVVVRYLVIAVVIVAVLQKFGIQTTSLVAVLGAGALAIGLALQGALGNVASGIMIAFLRPYKLNDFVEINGKEGKVVDIDLFFTELKTNDGRRIFVPNGQAVSNPIVNYTTQQQRRCVITFGIGYEDDIDQALQVLRDTMTGDPRAATEPPAWFGVEALADSSVNLSARVWVSTDAYFGYRTDMLKLVKEAFDREGIEILYPHAVQISKGEVPLRAAPIKPAAATPAR
jgi:small conductance mechanosensitive channel